MFSSNRDELRRLFFIAWQKYQEKRAMEPLEAQILEIILQHPEYHAVVSNQDYQTKDFSTENPFLHMSLHLALREQIHTNRPHGITEIYHALCIKWQDPLIVEHRMMECLATILWESQQSGVMPDEEKYLQKLRTIIR